MEDIIKTDSNILSELEADAATDVDSMISDDIEVSDSESLQEDELQSGFLPLPSGRALSLQDTYDVMASENTAVIVLVGPSGCGKTTIESTIYQLFQREKLENHLFAGSKTIQGYEDRSFYTRINSRQEIATTPRTSRGVQEIFLHLRLFNEDKKQIANYLFADLSGEEIQAHIANVGSLAKQMPFLKNADSITVILDGERLANKYRRNGVIEEASTMIRTIFDAGLYSVSTKVQLVISKFDIISASDDSTISCFIEDKIKELQSLITRYIKNVTVHEVAAMPHDSSFTVGFGLESLLSSWDYEPRYLHSSPQYEFDEPIDSEFNKLFYKLRGTTHE